MNRAFWLCAAFVVSMGLWCGLWMGAIFALLWFQRMFRTLDDAAVMALLFIAGGLMAIVAGMMLRAGALRWLQQPHQHAIGQGGVGVVLVGAALMLAGAGALALQAGV